MKFSMTNHVGCWLAVVMSSFNAFSVPLPQQPVTTETQKRDSEPRRLAGRRFQPVTKNLRRLIAAGDSQPKCHRQYAARPWNPLCAPMPPMPDSAMSEPSPFTAKAPMRPAPLSSTYRK